MNIVDALIRERKELSDKIINLVRFIYEDNGGYDNLCKAERVRLSQQHYAMLSYEKILTERILARKQDLNERT